jgi:4'-phosphopantetheinyl transferase
LQETALMTASFKNDSFEVIVAQLDSEPRTVRDAEALLSDDERKRADRFVFDRDRNRFIFARAGLRELLAARLGMQPESVELSYGPHGKPALAPEFSHEDLRFNTSHSEDVAVYALSQGRDIGVDVEAVRFIPDSDDIATHCFSTREKEAYRGLGADEKIAGFFNCWTRKEAFIKALGDGLHHPLDSFDVSLKPGDATKMLRIGSICEDHRGWQLYSFTPVTGYVGAVVIESPARSANGDF